MKIDYENETNTDYFYCLYHTILVVELRGDI